MKNNNVSSNPNDTVAIICSVIKGVDDSYSIDALEVAYGKLDEKGTDFICIDNKQSYECLSDNLYNLEEGKQYYCFDKTVDELRSIYGENCNINELMIDYLRSILKTYNFVNRDKENNYGIHSIPKEMIDSKSDDPIDVLDLDGRSKKKNTTKTETKIEDKKVYTSLKDIDYTDPNSVFENVNNLEFEKFLKDRVIGNDRVIEDTVTTIIMNLTTNDPKQVCNILTVGPTGTGKTYTYELISEYLGVPFVRVNASTLSTAGYKGDDTSDLLGKIWQKSKHNVALANKAIVMLDEFDKLKKSDLSIKEAAQNELLTLLEGSKIDFEVNPHTGERLELDTGCMTFIGSGAFSELFRGNKNDFLKQPVGFFTEEQKAEQKKELDKKTGKSKLTKDELIEYGMKEELIGRFRIYNIYANLDAEGLKRVLRESKGSILNLRKARYLEQFNLDFDVDDSFVDEIVKMALAENLGGRSLNNVTDSVFSRIDRQVLMLPHNERQSFILTKENIENVDKQLVLTKKM